jgi:polysaccharide chain length determinant protein (PEP-CTERM system associated)
MLEQLSVPRRAFDFEDYIDMLRRNRRWLIAPAFFGLVLSTVIAYWLDDTYVSHALIRLVPQQINESLVETATSQQLADHINAMAESIESRNTLTNLINTYGLYKRELKSEPLEDVVNQMRTTDIKIQPTSGVANVTGKNLPAMQVSFSYRDRYLAQKVCADLVSRFMSEHTVDRMTNERATNDFLNDEFEHAKRDLDTLDQKLTDFRKRNAGRLPEQMQMNVSQMNALEQRLSTLNSAASRNNEQRMLLESDLRIAKDRLASIKDVQPQTQARNEHLLDLDRQIQKLETNIADLKDRYTEDFPDLQTARAQLAVLKRQRDEAAKQEKIAPKSETAAENPSVARERQDAKAAIDVLQTQLKANAMQAQQIDKELQSVSAAVKTYQARVADSPTGDQQYAELIRDRDLAKQKYQELEAKRQKSAISMDMESHQQGETLEVLDPASLPTTPTAPKRSLIIPLGAIGGLLLGIVLIAIREIKNTTLKNLKDARLYTNLPILGSIPLLENDRVVRRRRRFAWLGWATATLAGLAIMAASVARYYWRA